MLAPGVKVLTVNGGSSSIKFACYDVEEPHIRRMYGKIERIGVERTAFTFNTGNGQPDEAGIIEAPDYPSAINFLLRWMKEQKDFASVTAIGHRVVHGMHHTQPEYITPELLNELKHICLFDPEHLPGEIALIEAFRNDNPGLVHVACFDTAFHANMPRVARQLPIARRFETMGLRRYGFHGISYSYLMETLGRIAGDNIARGKVIAAHLGNGASLAAVMDADSMDTSMGFTPAGGIPMSSRTGDIDPGVAWYIMQHQNLTGLQFNNLINHESGLLGISETTSDMQELLKMETGDVRAAEAIALFCYQIKKCIGAYAAVLDGLDTLIFSGGIGENAPVIRQRICAGLGFLGIALDERLNEANAPLISSPESRVSVRVIHTDEEWMIAKTVCGMLK